VEPLVAAGRENGVAVDLKDDGTSEGGMGWFGRAKNRWEVDEVVESRLQRRGERGTTRDFFCRRTSVPYMR
jgi:hypothetical protein